MRARLVFVVGVLATFSALWAGCSIYRQDLLVASNDASVDGPAVADVTTADTNAADGPGLTEAGLRDASDAGASVDASSDAGGDGPGCVLSHPPPAPTQDDPSDAGNLGVVFAVRTFDLGIRADGGPPPLTGYDIDDLCTCPGPGDCVAPDDGGVSCDEPGGVDNVGEVALRNFYELSGGNIFSQVTLNSEIATGHNTMLVGISEYNGTPNDTQVDVAVYVSDGTPLTDDGGGPHVVPGWDGGDSWVVDSRTVFGGAGPPIVPLYFDLQAYVTNGLLVASFGEALVPLQIDESDLMILELDSAILTGTIAQSGGTWTLQDGVVDGRLAVSKLLAAFAYVHDPANPNADLCPSSTTYTDLKGFVCPGLDVTDNPGAAHTVACDAMSMAIGFGAQAAQFGPVQTQARPTTCPDGGPDHC